MFTAFSTALSALQGDGTAIDIIGNNLANLNTTGYKSTDAQFSDLMAETMGWTSNPTQVGLGVGQVGSLTQYTQGTIQTTNGPTDAAIQGNGFFVVKNASNQTLYTRAGDFQVDANGNLVTATGEKVQGWSAVNGTVNPNSAIGNITVPLGGTVAANPTSTMSINANLDATPFNATTPATFSAPVQVFDSLGNSHNLTVTFTQTATSAWGYTVTIPAADASSGGTTTPLATGSLTFDANGNITNSGTPVPPSTTPPPVVQAISITGLTDGAAPLNINWNLTDSSGNSAITQVAQPSGVSATTQNGYAAGQISSVAFQNGGTIVASYTNGQQATVGQLALATITNPQSLLSVGNNELQATSTTAQPAIGTANSSGRGQIVAGSLESSTVDMATQFTDLLTMERSYQAASRVITTSDQLLQETVNLIHS
jgi:flagellar hook protein FlgE